MTLLMSSFILSANDVLGSMSFRSLDILGLNLWMSSDKSMYKELMTSSIGVLAHSHTAKMPSCVLPHIPRSKMIGKIWEFAALQELPKLGYGHFTYTRVPALDPALVLGYHFLHFIF